MILSDSQFKASTVSSDEEDEPNQVEGAWLGYEDLAAQEEDTVVRGGRVCVCEECALCVCVCVMY